MGTSRPRLGVRGGRDLPSKTVRFFSTSCGLARACVLLVRVRARSPPRGNFVKHRWLGTRPRWQLSVEEQAEFELREDDGSRGPRPRLVVSGLRKPGKGGARARDVQRRERKRRKKENVKKNKRVPRAVLASSVFRLSLSLPSKL